MNGERGRFHSGSVATRLRREAAADRPAFSAEWHERVVRRLVADGKGPRAPQPKVAEPLAVEPRRRWIVAVIPLAAAVVVAATVVVLMHPGPDLRIGGAGQGERPASDAAVASVPAEADGPVGLERLPMFDEIDAGVRDGVASLAASLLEVPDWTMLAELDAGAVLDPGAWSPASP
ncbi:MAG: hypothetical protein ACKOCX_07315 [Planctomycetota bacterium]